MKYKTYNSEVNYMVKTVLDAYKIIKSGKMNVWEKEEDNYVTNLDLEVEKFILSRMQQRFPEHSVVSEEFNPEGKMSENCYTIDPIDGTVNFSSGLGHWAIQVALISGGKNVASVLYFPVENELFTATLGGGAFLNGKQIHVSNTETKSTVYNYVVSHKKCVDDMGLLESLRTVSRHFRSMGSQSSAFANLACGRIGATVFGAYSRWDIEPGRLLASEAGAKFADHEGEYIIAGNSDDIVQKMDDIAKKFLLHKKTGTKK